MFIIGLGVRRILKEIGLDGTPTWNHLRQLIQRDTFSRRLLNESTVNACPSRNQIYYPASLDPTRRVLSGEQIRIVLHQVKNSFLFHFSLYHYIETSAVDPTNVKEVFGYHFNVV